MILGTAPYSAVCSTGNDVLSLPLYGSTAFQAFLAKLRFLPVSACFSASLPYCVWSVAYVRIYVCIHFLYVHEYFIERTVLRTLRQIFRSTDRNEPAEQHLPRAGASRLLFCIEAPGWPAGRSTGISGTTPHARGKQRSKSLIAIAVLPFYLYSIANLLALSNFFLSSSSQSTESLRFWNSLDCF